MENIERIKNLEEKVERFKQIEVKFELLTGTKTVYI
jgi:hypothetical protein